MEEADDVSASDVVYRPGLLADKRGWRRYVGPKRIVLGLALAAFVGCGWYLWHNDIIGPAQVLAWVAENPTLSAALFFGVYTGCIVAMLPTLPLNLAAGFLWGAVGGGILSTLAASTGATIAFAAARVVVGQPLARRFDNKTIAWFQDEFARTGWRFIAFVRVNPIFPTGPLNYLLGMTSVGFLAYTLATIVFLLPPSIAVAWIGREAGGFVLSGDAAELWTRILGVSAAITLLVAIRYAYKFASRRQRRGRA